MRNRLLTIVALAAMLAAGCGPGYQANNQLKNTGTQAEAQAQAKNTAIAKKLSSVKGYGPTADDVSRYKNDTNAFLQDNVTDFSRFDKAIIMIDGAEAKSISGVKLSDIQLISVLDKDSAAILGTIPAGGAIVIKTKKK